MSWATKQWLGLVLDVCYWHIGTCNSEPNSTSTIARGRTVAWRASVAVIFSSGMAHSKLSLREVRPPGAAAGLSQQDQMLVAVAGEVTGAGSPTSAADINSTRDRIACSSYLGGSYRLGNPGTDEY